MKEFFRIILYKPFFNLLMLFVWIFPGHSIGWGIILLTLLVRFLLWTPSAKALIGPLKMRQYQPQIKEIQDRYKDDRPAQAQATMAFYKEKGINPLSGCLTLLIQLPIILILYRVFIAGLGLPRPDLLYSFTPNFALNPHFLGIDLAHPDKLFILPLLAGVLQFFQTRHMSQLTPPAPSGKNADPSAMMMKQSQYLFPAMTFFIALRLPAGLALYWSVTTAFSLVQQLYLARHFHPETTASVSVQVRAKKS